MYRGLALLALLLLWACTGDDEGGAASTCGSCSIPICGSPSPCDCNCFQGDTMRNGELVCTADSCFAPAGGSDGGGTGGASTAGRSGAGGSKAAAAAGKSGAGGARADGGLPQDAAADAAVDASSDSGAVIDAAVTPVVCSPLDVKSVRDPETGCRFVLNVVVRAGDECLGFVKLNGSQLPCVGPDGWRMPDMTTVELVGTACAALQGESPVSVDIGFPCKAIVEFR